jgi:peptidoglycan/LPS O-acetylase OafA/YrhL
MSGSEISRREPTRKLNALTGLRFFAAASIVYLHYRGSFGIPVNTSFAFGQGVSYFFVLSGFVLTYVYPSLPSWRERCDFFAARIGRLWPAHVVGIVLTLILVSPPPWGHNFDMSVIADLLMVQTWVPVEGFFYSINGPSWSISTEFGLYILFLLLINNFERTWLRKLLFSAFITAAILITAFALDLELDTQSPPALTGQSLLLEFPFGRLLEFVGGMCVAVLYRRRLLPQRFGFLVSTALEIGIVALIVVNAAAPQLAWPMWRNNPLVWYVGSSAVIPACAAIYVFAHERGLVSKILAWTPIVLLGEISYSLYLFHSPVGYYFATNKAATTPDEATLILLIACLVSISYFSWMLFETPVRMTIRRMLGRATARLWAATPTQPMAEYSSVQDRFA